MSGYRSIFRSDLFEGKVAIITGGGSGIGRCITHELASLGATVAIVGRKLEKLERVRDELREDGFDASLFVCDIREEEAVRATVKAIVAKHGRVDALVNNAGGQFPAPLAFINQKGFETVVRTNLVGGFVFAREVYAQSMREHGGSIVNIIADMWRGMPGMGHSGAARAGMLNVTMSMAVEWAAEGVRVNAVAPGWIASSGLDSYEGAARALIPSLRSHVPLYRLGTEAEVSAAVTYLLSPGAAFITGECIRVDGGAPLDSALVPTRKSDRSTEFDGFHRAVRPKILDEES